MVLELFFFQYEHLEVLFIVNCISFEARGPCREKFNVLFYTRTCNYIFCKMYINSCHLHKSSHWLSPTPMRNNPREMQMTISDIFSVTAHRSVYMNLNNCKQHVVLPRSACCYSEILFPRTCKNQPQTLIVYEYSYENRHFFYYQIIDSTYTSSIFIKNCKFFYKLLNLLNEV